MPSVAEHSYGKDNVPLFHRVRDEATGVETATEMTVCCLLKGTEKVVKSYTEADNAHIVATDSIKNTIYIKATQHPVNPPELFASILCQHFLDTYDWMNEATVDIVVHRWTRMTIDGKEHPHSFYRDGNEKRKTTVHAARRGQGVEFALESSIADLLVLKTTASAFYGFVRDEYTTLPETRDRILSTSVDAKWTWKPLPGLDAVQEKAGLFNKAYEDARGITMKTFAEENSPSVQATMFNMGKQILAVAPDVESVFYALPNKHYFELDLSWHNGIKNTGKDAQVYVPQFGANGLIKCTVVRDEA